MHKGQGYPEWQTRNWSRSRCPLTDSKDFVDPPNSAGITNTICRAELAAKAAAITQSYSHIASESLTSLHQISKQLIYPEKHKQHVQGDVLKIISTLISNSKTNICFYKVRSHAGIQCRCYSKTQANQAKKRKRKRKVYASREAACIEERFPD
eukprot:1150141-Pelagomonas_calceolata.AAC.2